MTHDEEYYEGLAKCHERYKFMLSDALWEQRLVSFPADIKNDLVRFISLFGERVEAKDPIRKLCRWLGNIQGKLHMMGVTIDEIERDWTRPLFRHLDFPEE